MAIFKRFCVIFSLFFSSFVVLHSMTEEAIELNNQQKDQKYGENLWDTLQVFFDFHGIYDFQEGREREVNDSLRDGILQEITNFVQQGQFLDLASWSDYFYKSFRLKSFDTREKIIDLLLILYPRIFFEKSGFLGWWGKPVVNKYHTAILQQAINHDHYKALICILKAMKINVHQFETAHGQPLLTFFVNNKKKDILSMLVKECNAQINAIDKYGYAPLHYAVLQGDLDLVSFLVNECGAYVNKQDGYGRTPLHLAAGVLEQSDVRQTMVRCLKVLGADVWAYDAHGLIPADQAYHDVQHLVLDRGDTDGICARLTRKVDVGNDYSKDFRAYFKKQLKRLRGDDELNHPVFTSSHIFLNQEAQDRFCIADRGHRRVELFEEKFDRKRQQLLENNQKIAELKAQEIEQECEKFKQQHCVLSEQEVMKQAREPYTDEWLQALKTCNAELIKQLQERTLLENKLTQKKDPELQTMIDDLISQNCDIERDLYESKRKRRCLEEHYTCNR